MSTPLLCQGSLQRRRAERGCEEPVWGQGVLVSMHVADMMLVGTPLEPYSLEPVSQQVLTPRGRFYLNLQTSSWLRVTEGRYGGGFCHEPCLARPS